MAYNHYMSSSNVVIDYILIVIFLVEYHDCYPVTSIDDFLLEEFPADVGAVGIREGLVGSLHQLPILLFHT